jgi:GxxExxY protein
MERGSIRIIRIDQDFSGQDLWNLAVFVVLSIDELKKRAMKKNRLHFEITEKIIKAYFQVYNTLGFGFLEKVYENAMMIELDLMGIQVVQQPHIPVFYRSKTVGDYFGDLLVENKVVVELKAVKEINEDHEAQLVNYLRATELEVGLLLNFGKEPEFSRRVLTNAYKRWHPDHKKS